MLARIRKNLELFTESDSSRVRAKKNGALEGAVLII